MTSDSDPHEEFEIAALRRARAALDEDGVARLDAHLATCAACRGFAATDAAAATALRRRAAEAAASRDLAKTRASVRARAARDRVRLANVAILAALVFVLILSMEGRGIGDWDWQEIASLLVVHATIPVVVYVAWYLPRRRRDAEAESLASGELLRNHRRDLDKEVGDLVWRQDRAVGVVTTILFMDLYYAHEEAQLDDLLPGYANWRKIAVLAAIGVYVATWVGWRYFVDLPRLERERRDLGR
jgi:predicted anti-sigma-YlaC factor YlaD